MKIHYYLVTHKYINTFLHKNTFPALNAKSISSSSCHPNPAAPLSKSKKKTGSMRTYYP